MKPCATCGKLVITEELRAIESKADKITREYCETCYPEAYKEKKKLTIAEILAVKLKPEERAAVIDNSINKSGRTPEDNTDESPKQVRFDAVKITQALTKRLQDYTSSNHYKFFNQTVEEVRDLSIEEIRDRIIQYSEDLFGASAEEIRKRTKLQATISVFSEKARKISETEKEALRVADTQYVPSRLTSPLKAIEKKKKTAKKFEDKMKALFGDNHEEMMKKLMED